MVSTNIVTVTPDLAKEYLAENKGNRKITAAAVRRYSDAMKHKAWLFDGAPIRVAKDGTLLDGQHRLLAVVDSNTTQDFLVIEGLPPEVQAVMDTGKKRSLGDVLSMHGEVNVLQLASIVSLAQRWEQGMRGNILVHGSFPNDKRFYEPQIPELLEFLEAHPELREGAKRGTTLRNHIPVPPRLIGLSYWVFSTIDQEDADYFFDKLKSGSALEEGSPILTLRQTLIRQAASGTTRPQSHTLALIFKAWNFYREGEPMFKMTLKFGGSNPESYPEPK